MIATGAGVVTRVVLAAVCPEGWLLAVDAACAGVVLRCGAVVEIAASLLVVEREEAVADELDPAPLAPVGSTISCPALNLRGSEMLLSAIRSLTRTPKRRAMVENESPACTV